jgi:molecular chaperone HscA
VTLLEIHEPGQTPQPHEARHSAVGIDLGTTNSLVAVAHDNRPEVLRDGKGGSALVPSVVAYLADGPVLVGEEAKAHLLTDPDRVVSSVKRLMGRGVEDMKALAGTLPFDAEPSPDGVGMIRVNIAGRSLTPVEISAVILADLKGRGERALGHDVTNAVVTVPAYFDDAARAATKDAAKLAGLDVLRLVNEPTAAALAYGLDRAAEGLFAVYDLGGGTFDISILRMQMGVFQVIATGGDAALGGDDFDHAIAEHFLAERNHDGGLTPVEAKLALATARVAKECLTDQERGEWVIKSGGRSSRHILDRAKLETLLVPFVERTLATCRSVLADADLDAGDLSGVVLVGGSTRLPLVRRRVAEVFGREPLSDIDPDEVVALGAALQAEALSVGSDTLLLDVTPLSLGIETMGGLVEKVIPRNTPIPAARAQDFTTYQDGQTGMAIHAVQGEREMVDQNRSLAKFELTGIPPMTAGAARIRVTFSVDADGLLTVAAEEQATGTRQEVAVRPSYGLNEDEMAQMLRDSMVHAREDMTARLLAEARVDAERALIALDAALVSDGDLLDEEGRAALAAQMADVRAKVSGQDRGAIVASSETLEEISKSFAERRMDHGIREALQGVGIDRLESSLETSESQESN